MTTTDKTTLTIQERDRYTCRSCGAKPSREDVSKGYAGKLYHDREGNKCGPVADSGMKVTAHHA